MADTHMQVWLDTVGGTLPSVVVPCVQTDQDARLTYRVNVVRKGKSGYSRINQTGTVTAKAGSRSELSRLSVAAQEGDDCHIEIDLLEEGQLRASFRFECPR